MVKKFTAKEILERLWPLMFIPQVFFLRPIGVELEGFVYDKNGEPVDLSAHLDIFKNVQSVWYAGHDLGKNQLEIAFHPYENIRSYVRSLYEVFSFFASNKVTKEWVFLFSGTAEKTLGAAEGLAYKTKIESLKKEHPDGGDLIVSGMTEHSATQLNFGIVDIFEEFGKKVLFANINWAPVLCVVLEAGVGDLYNNMRLPNAYKFASDVRGFHYKDWEFCKTVQERLFEVPQLYAVTPKGDYKYYGKSPQGFNQIHLGSIYWPSRFNGILESGAGRYRGRIEARAPSSMPPQATPFAVLLYDHLLKFIKRTPIAELPLLSEEDWYYIQSKEDPERALAMAEEFVRSKLPISEEYFLT